MKEQQIINAYEIAKERYAKLGIDTDAVMETLQSVPMSMHCWQADDVTGFESQGSLTGGIQATGNYPGKARNIEELRADILKAASYVPGKHRLNLHEIYGEFGGQFVDRDQVEVKHFEGWMQWSKENDMKLDFNSTSFSHPKSETCLCQILTRLSVISGLNILSVAVPLLKKWVSVREMHVS